MGYKVIMVENDNILEKAKATMKIEEYLQDKMDDFKKIFDEIQKKDVFLTPKILFNYQMFHWVEKGYFTFDVYFREDCPIHISGSYDSNTDTIRELYFKSDQTYQGDWNKYFRDLTNFGNKDFKVNQESIDKLKEYGDRMNKYLDKWLIKPQDNCSQLGQIKGKETTVEELKNNMKPECYTYFTPIIEHMPLQLFEDMNVFKAFYDCIYKYEGIVDKVFGDIAESYFQFKNEKSIV